MAISSLFKWRPVTTALIIGGVVIVLVASVIAFAITNFRLSTTLRIGDGVYTARLAEDESSRDKLLKATETLGDGKAFIMVYPDNSKWAIEKSDVGATLDVVWLDQDKKVIYIVKNLSPDDTNATTFAPSSAARYIVGLPAGTVDGRAVKVGLAAVFDNNERGAK